ncbi:MAG TPA: hypothetical protein VJ987_04500 [Anaerolineales bacterium]|nr:hypothetical protein [Anaerolineales bacterium]
MNRKLITPALGLFLILGGVLHSNNLIPVRASNLADGHTLVLYDANLGETPSAPAMNFIGFPTGAASLTYLDGGTVLDTTELGSDAYAGWVSNEASVSGFPSLDRTIGFQVDFTMQMEKELHQNNNRTGFSVIVLSDDAMGVELAFWENEIWAQSDENTGGLFKHGEGTSFATTAAFTEYQISILDDNYTLTANAQPILTGPVRDYSGFEGFPDPYETPNFLFVGDDTTSAQARISLRFLSVTGSEPATPVATNTSVVHTSTAPVPLDTVPPTIQPSVKPIPASPTPGGRPFDVCPSGWISLLLFPVLGWVSRKMML